MPTRTTALQDHAHIRAPAEEVFHLLTDLRRLPEWATPVLETDGPASLEPASRFHQRVRVLGLTFRIDCEVVAIDPPHSVEYRAEAPRGGHATMTQVVVPEDEGCRVEVAIDYCMPGGAAVATFVRLAGAIVNERVARRALANLKRVAESAHAQSGR